MLGILKALAKPAGKAIKGLQTRLGRMSDDIEIKGSTDFADDVGASFDLLAAPKTKKGLRELNKLVDEGLASKQGDSFFIASNKRMEALEDLFPFEGENLRASGFFDDVDDFLTVDDLKKMQPPFGYDDMLEYLSRGRKADGGRVNMQTGGAASYEDILANIQASYPTDAQQTMTRPGPQGEALQSIFGPVLAQFLGRPISPTGGTNVFGQQFGSFIPQQQAQNVLQQQQIQQALNQAGLGTAQFDPTTGGLTGVTGTGTGVAGFQPFLDAATTTANLASQEAVAGQDAGLQQLQNAAAQANLAGLAAIAGQDAGAGGITAAQNIADQAQAAAIAGQDAAQPFLDRAAQLAQPRAFEDFLSPYQEQVIDLTRQELERQLQAQQAQLGAGAGAAFGGGRFGIAEGELAATGARGIASTLAGLRQTGFEQARQAAANALGQQLALGQAAQGQAGQNLGLLGQALQGQIAGAGAAQAQAGQNVNLFGAAGGQQIQTGTAMGQQAGQDIGLLGQATGIQSGLASLQPQLAAQTIGTLGQLGTQQQAIGQAGLDTLAQGQQMIATMPMQQLGFFGSQLPVFTGGTVYQQPGPVGPGPSPLSQVLGGIAGIGGTALSLGSLFT